MITRLLIPGGSYSEAFPDGTYRVLVGKDVLAGKDTQVPHRTYVNPFRAPLHMRFDGVQQFAGQEADSAPGLRDGGAVIHFDGSQWNKFGTTCGVNACAFGPHGLVVNDHCQYGTQGIRWIDPDGTIHTGDETYDGRNTTGVAEWTRAGNVVLGQSYVDGCTIKRDGDVPRQLEPGHCTFEHLNRAGSTLAVSMWKQLENCAVLFWLDESDIASLKPEPIAPQPNPVPNPRPEPEPEPEPEPIPTMNYNTGPLNEYAQRRWQELPHGTRHEQAATLFRILYEYRQQSGDPIEVFRKGTGGTHFLGSDGHGYAEDICVINEGAHGKWYKDVGVAFGASTARLDFGGEWLRPSLGDEARCFPPPQPAGVEPQPEPEPEPEPEPQPDPELEARVIRLEQVLNGIATSISAQQQHLTALEASTAKIAQRVEKLEQAPSGGGSFDPSKYQTKTKVNLGFREITYTGTIEPKR